MYELFVLMLFSNDLVLILVALLLLGNDFQLLIQEIINVTSHTVTLFNF